MKTIGMLAGLALLCPALLVCQEKIMTPWTKALKPSVPLEAGAAGLHELTLDFPATKMYRITLTFKPSVGAVSGEIQVEGDTMEKFKLAAGATSAEIPPVFFDAGAMKLGIKVTKGKLDLESIAIRDSLTQHAGPPQSIPVNPNASPATKKLMSFLATEYGKHILSGQQDLTWDDHVDMVARVKAMTGKEPAILGFDFMNYVGIPYATSGQHQVEEAIAWHQRGGIVAFCWHWRVGASKEFYSAKTDFRFRPDPASPEYQQVVKDIDAIAALLKRLQDAGVPVLWRPLHEASGGWFWWGASGPAPYKALWNLIYDRLTNFHQLNNLIWVWNGQNGDWYPGDATIDVVGTDIYANDKVYSSWKDSWTLNQAMVQGAQAKIVTLSENGPIPDPDNLVRDQVPWSWFMTWNDGNQGKPEDDFFSGDKYMDRAHKIKVFNHPYVLTLDRLPDLKP